MGSEAGDLEDSRNERSIGIYNDQINMMVMMINYASSRKPIFLYYRSLTKVRNATQNAFMMNDTTMALPDTDNSLIRKQQCLRLYAFSKAR
jgi:hypothetical protein